MVSLNEVKTSQCTQKGFINKGGISSVVLYYSFLDFITAFSTYIIHEH